jgi:competence ComEA-like helix-hairpin-helix protein
LEKKRRINMKCRFVYVLATAVMAVFFVVCVASAQDGHTGGLGEERIQFNYASDVNLAKAPGITPEIAEAICDYRDEEGFFTKPEDLLSVPGINQKVYEEINPQLGTEGDLYTVPRPGEELEEEDEDIPLAPSKC